MQINARRSNSTGAFSFVSLAIFLSFPNRSLALFGCIILFIGKEGPGARVLCCLCIFPYGFRSSVFQNGRSSIIQNCTSSSSKAFQSLFSIFSLRSLLLRSLFSIAFRLARSSCAQEISPERVLCVLFDERMKNNKREFIRARAREGKKLKAHV